MRGEELDKAVRYYGKLLADNGISVLTDIEISVEYPIKFGLKVKGYDKGSVK